MYIMKQGSVNIYNCLWACGTGGGVVEGLVSRSITCKLGRYATDERAREVASEIQTMIRTGHTGTYTMPDE